MIEKTVEKSEAQAEVIKSIAFQVIILDTEYCKEISKEMIERADWQDSASVLSPDHSFIKTQMNRTQGKALSLLCQYVETLKEVERLKVELAAEKNNAEDIAKLFL